MRLANKVVLISGGSRGMGASEAKLFSSEGATVIIGDILETEGHALATEITGHGGTALYLHLDVTKENEWIHIVDRINRTFGKLDVLVNNAGITGQGTIEDLPQKDWEHVMDVNSTGVFLGIKTVIPAMKESGGGSIINISSQLGIVGGEFSDPAYQASKGAIRILTKNVAVQYAKYNIRCNSVHPGPIETPMTADKRSDPEFLRSLTSKVPLGRIGLPEEVAYGVLYFASDESAYVTGSELVIDGGWVAQ